ncbi:DUF6757 family protein [Halomarina pelagica]|uniref:DUF6757 family protein n=1 Tax=Halomarina pelagica TaxID=2961599 RepID=UPI0020C48367|nr:DUF6757 family protein [Halomarina sp. BND7]
MQCHYCSDEADIAVERGGVTVGLCQIHFRERLDELQEEGWLDDLRSELEMDRFD